MRRGSDLDMAAYGFENNYAKAWPSGEVPEVQRRVMDCGQLSVVGIGQNGQFDMEIPIHDGRPLSESEIWLSLSMRIEADEKALNLGGSGVGSGGNRLLTTEVQGRDAADGDLIYMTETRNEQGKIVQGSIIYTSLQHPYFYEDKDGKRVFLYVNSTFPIFRHKDIIGLKKAIVRLVLRRPFGDPTYEYRVEAELNYCVIGTPLKEEAEG